jgi:hypothetical protein
MLQNLQAISLHSAHNCMSHYVLQIMIMEVYFLILLYLSTCQFTYLGLNFKTKTKYILLVQNKSIQW